MLKENFRSSSALLSAKSRSNYIRLLRAASSHSCPVTIMQLM